MTRILRILLQITIAMMIVIVPATDNIAQSLPAPAKQLRWYKGNTHTHTTNSDGDSAPADVVDWYKRNKYDFLVITDHEHITAVDELNKQFGIDGKFLVIQGQEITDRFDTKP